MSPSERRGPTPEELAAIVAAVEMAWPQGVVVADSQPEPRPWRWSGRWWATGRPVAADRRRPTGM